jgi:hypothetical protein
MVSTRHLGRIRFRKFIPTLASRANFAVPSNYRFLARFAFGEQCAHTVAIKRFHLLVVDEVASAQSNSAIICTGTGEPSFVAGLNCIALTAVATSFIFSSRSPLGDSVLNHSTRPFASMVMSKAILLVPDSRSFVTAASHIACGGFSLMESCCPVKAAVTPNTIRPDHKTTFFIERTFTPKPALSSRGKEHEREYTGEGERNWGPSRERHRLVRKNSPCAFLS